MIPFSSFFLCENPAEEESATKCKNITIDNIWLFRYSNVKNWKVAIG